MLFDFQEPAIAKPSKPIEDVITYEDRHAVSELTLNTLSDGAARERIRWFLRSNRGAILAQCRETGEVKALSDEAADYVLVAAFLVGELRLINEGLWRWRTFDGARLFVLSDKSRALRNAIAPQNQKPQPRPASDSDIATRLERIADGARTEQECRELLEAEIGHHLVEERWRNAWGNLPADRKRRRGRPKALKDK